MHPNQALPWALCAGQLKATELLLDAGADLDRKLGGHMGVRTPLMFAAEGGPVVVDLLLDRGAHPRAVDDNHKTAAHELLERYAVHASNFGEPAIVNTLQKFLEAGVKPDRCTADGKAMLELAIQGGAGPDTLRVLEQRGARLDLRNPEGLEPIHIAALSCNLPAMDLLLARGIAPDAEDANGMSALFHCTNAAAAKYLIDRGANVEHADLQGRTPLHKLLKEMKPTSPTEVVKVLLDAGARTDAPDWSGTTPADVIAARRLKNVKAVLAALTARQAIGRVLEKSSPRPS